MFTRGICINHLVNDSLHFAALVDVTFTRRYKVDRQAPCRSVYKGLGTLPLVPSAPLIYKGQAVNTLVNTCLQGRLITALVNTGYKDNQMNYLVKHIQTSQLQGLLV